MHNDLKPLVAGLETDQLYASVKPYADSNMYVSAICQMLDLGYDGAVVKCITENVRKSFGNR